jgi:hypothetical protein
MSSDFIWTGFRIRKGQDLEKTRKAMLDSLERGIKAGKLYADNEQVISFYHQAYGENPPSHEEAWDAIENTINEVFDEIESEKCAGSYTFYGWTMFFTGGLSWGDDPSEAFKYFCDFVTLPKSILRAGNIRF